MQRKPTRWRTRDLDKSFIEPSAQPKLYQSTLADHNNPLRCCINNLQASQQFLQLLGYNEYNPAFDVKSYSQTVL